MEKTDRAGIHSFQLRAYGRLSRITFTEKRSNKCVLDEISEMKDLLTKKERQKRHFMGHNKRHRCIENDVLTGTVFGKKIKRTEENQNDKFKLREAKCVFFWE